MTAFTGSAGSSDWFYIKHTHLGFPDDTLISNWTTSPGVPATGDAISIDGFSVTNGSGTYATLNLTAGSSLASSGLTFTAGITNAGTLTSGANLGVSGAAFTHPLATGGNL